MAFLGVLAFDFVVSRPIHVDLSFGCEFSGGAMVNGVEDRQRYYKTSAQFNVLEK
jgi:hypothetical protein